ncbi:MAG: hypothetical protein J5I53_07350 [Bradyrhizobiaceae bacterium]|nr:hypothetical protein [Bradyrhizobiaceae bacterium]
MPELSIESNGLLETTAVYYNGEQLRGVRELLLNIDENGTFDAILQYKGSDGQMHTKNVLQEYLDNVATGEPSFTEEEAQSLRLLTIDSDGSLENTIVALDGEQQQGIVSLYVRIKAPPEIEFTAEITYREEDGQLTREGVF